MTLPKSSRRRALRRSNCGQVQGSLSPSCSTGRNTLAVIKCLDKDCVEVMAPTATRAQTQPDAARFEGTLLDKGKGTTDRNRLKSA